MKTIVLDSASPRRKALLKQIGLKFKVDTGVQEDILNMGPEPHQYARQISLKKAQSVAGKYHDAIIIAADTFGVIDGRILGKPHSESEARAMLETINGRRHAVITGFTIMDTGTAKTLSSSVETTVFIKHLTKTEIENYVKSGEPLDKAGAYAIQGLGAVIVERIEGDYSNVMGLPLSALTTALKEFGINVL
jgi:septum formation protein